MSTAASREEKRWRGLAVWLLVTFAASAIGAIASADAAARYGALVQPAWAPPSWLFGPVWTVLYALMGVAAWRVWLRRGWDGARGPLVLYLSQLIANGLWTWLFFAWELRGLAFAEILVLLGLIVLLLVWFSRIDAWAGRLLLPYLAWVSFASALSYSTWQLNLAA